MLGWTTQTYIWKIIRETQRFRRANEHSMLYLSWNFNSNFIGVRQTKRKVLVVKPKRSKESAFNCPINLLFEFPISKFNASQWNCRPISQFALRSLTT